MADISQEINDFKNAIYGEEVRGSMISLAQKLNTEVEENTTNVNQAVKTANSASSAANQAVQNANTTLQAANQAVQNAAGSASAAAGSASAAAGSAEDAADCAAAASGSASAAAQSAANAAEVAEGLGGFTGAASSVTAQDVEGLLGSPGAQSNVQALIDAIADQVLNQLVKKSQIINNLLATQAGNVLDATQGKALKDLIDQLNSDFAGVFAVIPPNTLLDNVKTAKFAYCEGVLLESSGSRTWGFLINIFSNDEAEGKQIFMGNTGNSLRIRTCHLSSWGNWETININ